MAAKKPGMGSSDGGGVKYNQPNPPKIGMGSAKDNSPKAAPVQPPKTPIKSAPSGTKGSRAQNVSYIGPFKKGGRVKKTGVALVHKGEHVVPAKGGRRKSSHRKKVGGKR